MIIVQFYGQTFASSPATTQNLNFFHRGEGKKATTNSFRVFIFAFHAAEAICTVFGTFCDRGSGNKA
jgi:hypothetical protein